MVSESDHTARYLAGVATIASRIDPDAVERLVLMCRRVRDARGRLFFVGSGGGAAHASHAAADFRQTAGIECYSPSDNTAELTARINDYGWATAYADWLRGSHLSKQDGLFVFSVGGGSIASNISVNLVNCLKLAQEVGASIAGIVGRDGGFTAEVGDAVVVVPTLSLDAVTAYTESFQAVLWHLIVTHPTLRQNRMKWESQP